MDLYSAQVRCCLSCPVIVVSTTNFLNTDINECSESIDDCDMNADCRHIQQLGHSYYYPQHIHLYLRVDKNIPFLGWEV